MLSDHAQARQGIIVERKISQGQPTLSTMSCLDTLALAARIDAWLPQTQCTRCGYPRCRLYAEAIARGEADINQCPPGGETTLSALADLLGVSAKPLNPLVGSHQPRARAVIDEEQCIGCRKCLEVCPVDAIVGAPKLMHTVIAQDCTGCELCLPPCPVDCITMVPVNVAQSQSPWPDYPLEATRRWRRHAQNRLRRLEHERCNHPKEAEPGAALGSSPPVTDEGRIREQMRAEIRAAVARVRARRVLSKIRE